MFVERVKNGRAESPACGGEAMKRSKANEGMRSRRYQALAALALSILIFAVGEARAAEPFKAWRKDKKTWVAAARLTEQSEKAKSVKWLVTDSSADKVAEFVSAFAKEPVKFAEGVRLAALELGKDAGSFEEKKKALLETLGKVADKEFGINKKVPLVLLAEAIFALDPKDLKEKDLEELLKEIFNEDMLASLGLVDEDPNKKPETTPTATATATPTATTAPTDDRSRAELERAQAEIERLRREAEARERERASGSQVGPQPQTPVVGGGAPSTSVPVVGSGELSDAALQKMAQDTCDRIDALKRSQENQLLSVVSPLRDALNEQFNQIAALRNLNPQNQNQNKNRVEDLLPQLLQQALNGDNRRRNDQPQLPPQPQQLAQRPNDNQDKNRSIFDQPVPQQPQEQPQQQPPLYIPPMPSADPQIGNIRLALPTATGRTELRSAMDRVAMNDARTPVATTLGPNAQVPDLIGARVRVQQDIRATQSELQQARYRAGELESALEVAQQDVRATLPEKYKRMEKDAKAELEAKKKQYEALRSQLQQGGNAEQAAQMQPILQQYQSEVTAAEARVKKISDEIEIAVENGSAEVKRLAKTRDQLNQTVTKLQEQLGTLKEEESGVSQLLTNAQQLQVQMLQQQQGPPPLRSIYNTAGPAQRSTSAPTSSVAGGVRRGSLANPSARP